MTEILQALVAFIGDHPNLALLIVFLISAGEALIIVGLFVPSTVVLVGAGTLIGMGKLPFLPIFIATTLGAIVGDSISYWIGHLLKHRVREFWPFNRYTSLLDQGETFFRKHGGKSILIGRFIPGVKAVVPGIAGMVGMHPVRFTLINAVSALLWSAVHVVPAIGLGRGIDVAQSSNPRLLALLLIVALFVALMWYGAKMAIGILFPIAERWQLKLIRLLSARESDASQWAARVLASESGVFAPFTYAVIALSALSGFIMLVGSLLFDPELIRSDEAISGYLQTLRTGLFDEVMTVITMAGDSIVLFAIALSLIATLLAFRRWRLASSVIVAFLAAALFVPIMKTVLNRARPTALYEGADAFSFPSGHATLSTTILGISVLLLVHPLADAYRRIAYLATAMAIAFIAISRVYLLAHWPSDVLAGILFGGSLVFAMALLLHGRSLRIPFGKLAGVVGAVSIGVYSAHLYYGYPAASAQYASSIPPTILDRQAWLETDWQELPRARILLGGETGEPTLVQTDLPLDAIIEALTSSGWVLRSSNRLDELLSSVVPSKGALSAHPPRPLTNNGKSPVATFARSTQASDERRLVLRVWQTGFVVQEGDQENPILQISVTAETLNPILFGFSLVEAVRIGNTAFQKIASDIVAALPGGSMLKAPDRPIYVATSDGFGPVIVP